MTHHGVQRNNANPALPFGMGPAGLRLRGVKRIRAQQTRRTAQEAARVNIINAIASHAKVIRMTVGLHMPGAGSADS